MLAEPTGGLFAGDAIAYDPEERLVSVTQGSSTLLANVYDGAGMRAIKTTAIGTTYFLDDASGAPVVEESYTASPTPTTTLSVVSAFGPDGLRQRYTATGAPSETSFFYDPQGSVVNRIVSSDAAVKNDGEPFTDVSVWDGYGQRRTDQWTLQNGDVQYAPNDPVGFEGQAGYYSDWELSQKQTLGSSQTNWVYLTTTPSLLTRRYYDASTGRFVSRDPIGYQGGTNLYSYCGGNPITNRDPSGLDTHVFETDSDIVVNTQLQFQGSKANAANAKRVVQDILKAWNKGFTYDGKPVRFNISYAVGGNAIDHYDQVYLEPGVMKQLPDGTWQYRSHVNALSGPGSYLLDQNKFSFWPQQTKIEHLYMGDPDFGWTAAHEFAHIIGYMDEYDINTGVPFRGWEHSILSTRGKPVDNGIIKLWGDYFQGHHGTWLKF